VPTIEAERTPLEFGKSEILSRNRGGAILCCGPLLSSCLDAARMLRGEGLEVGVINARFVKPLDSETVLRAIRECDFVVTVEEAALMAGFGSAVIEAAADAGLDASRIRRLGIPDRFIEHAERGELLADLGLGAAGIAATCRALANSSSPAENLPSATDDESAAWNPVR
jgi:1-deoxy-D-xylulose-5-phosphate synthase